MTIFSSNCLIGCERNSTKLGGKNRQPRNVNQEQQKGRPQHSRTITTPERNCSGIHEKVTINNDSTTTNNHGPQQTPPPPVRNPVRRSPCSPRYSRIPPLAGTPSSTPRPPLRCPPVRAPRTRRPRYPPSGDAGVPARFAVATPPDLKYPSCPPIAAFGPDRATKRHPRHASHCCTAVAPRALPSGAESSHAY